MSTATKTPPEGRGQALVFTLVPKWKFHVEQYSWPERASTRFLVRPGHSWGTYRFIFYKTLLRPEAVYFLTGGG